MACRLARFNAGVDFNQALWSRNFFMGVPAPAGAFLMCAPMVLSFRFPDSPFLADKFVVPYFLFVSFLLVSDVPTFSSKSISRALIRSLPLAVRAVCLLVGVVVAWFVINDVWGAYLAAAAVYLVSFAVSSVVFNVVRGADADAAAAAAAAAVHGGGADGTSRSTDDEDDEDDFSAIRNADGDLEVEIHLEEMSESRGAAAPPRRGRPRRSARR